MADLQEGGNEQAEREALGRCGSRWRQRWRVRLRVGARWGLGKGNVCWGRRTPAPCLLKCRVAHAMLHYRDGASWEIARWQHNLGLLSERHRALVPQLPAKIAAAQQCIYRNQLFLNALLAVFDEDDGISPPNLAPANSAAFEYEERVGSAVAPADHDKVRQVACDAHRCAPLGGLLAGWLAGLVKMAWWSLAPAVWRQCVLPCLHSPCLPAGPACSLSLLVAQVRA